MTQTPTSFRWSRAFVLRLLVSYIVIPLIPPALLLLSSRGMGSMGAGNWLGIFYIYGLFGLAAIVVLGTPLLVLFLRLGWTGYLPFMAGGGVCAGVTAYRLLNPNQNRDMLLFFTFTGIMAGLLFRVILFGFRGQPGMRAQKEM